jgi:hypothetical protein
MSNEAEAEEVKTEVVENQLTIAVKESGLDKTKAQVLLDNFSGYFQIASDWEKTAKALVITTIHQKVEMKKAREGRLFLKEKRIAIDKTRKNLKEASLREGQTIDALARILTNLIVPIEEDLKAKEEFAERLEAEQKKALNDLRVAETVVYSEFIPAGLDFGAMDESNYQKILTGAKLQQQAKIEAEAKAESDRLAKIEADVAEQKRIREENERLRIEAEAKEKALAEERAKVEAERKVQEDIARKEREAAEAKLKAEREKSESAAKAQEEAKAKELARVQAEWAAKAAIEKEKRDKDEAEFKAKMEAARIEKEKAEAEKAKLAAELKAKADKEAAELKAKEDADRKAANAPDKEKLFALALEIESFPFPVIVNPEGEKVLSNVAILMKKVVAYIRENTDKL